MPENRQEGSVKKVPLGSMPLIDTPFKRVAVDIVGPIAPPSEAGHRYILTLVDYATRYPEAVPLKKITTEAVAVALLDIYSRVGIPEEVLTDQLKVKEAMSSVDKSTIENLQKKDSTPRKCFDRIGKPIIRENYVGEEWIDIPEASRNQDGTKF